MMSKRIETRSHSNILSECDCVYLHAISVADPGFPKGAAPTLKSVIIFQIFC